MSLVEIVWKDACDLPLKDAAFQLWRYKNKFDDIAAILLERPATPFEIARRLQWQPEGARLLAGLAHVQGHLDLLQETGRVTPVITGGVARYQLRV